MTDKTFSDSSALEDKLERITALQQAIEQASREVHAAQILQPEEQRVMLRIMAQRRRLHQRTAQPALERARRATAQASNGGSGNGNASSAWGEASASAVPRSLVGDAGALMQAVPWVADAKDFAMRRPVSVGLALGATLVIIGPKRLFRSVLWWTPFVWRSMRVAQRVNTTLRKRY